MLLNFNEMNKNIVAYILLIISVGLMSCEQEVKLELPTSTPKLVLTSFISPQDTALVAVLTKSTPIFEGRDYYANNKNVKDAVVTISSDDEVASLYYNDELGKYISDINGMHIEAGETYFIKATTPEGLTAEGFCTVPQGNNSLNFTYTKIGVTEWGAEEYVINMHWEASSNDSYAFRVYSELETSQVFYDDTVTNYSQVYIPEPYALKGNDEYSRAGDLYYHNYDFYRKKIRASLLNVDENYYRYHKSVATYSGDNPFAEPAPIYTNIKGGLGVFAAYNTYRVVKEFN